VKTWGGARAGAGRPPNGEGAGMPHDTRPLLASRHPVHVTVRMRPHVWNLRAKRSFRILERAFAKARERNGMRLCHFSVQGNHLHLLVEAKDKDALAQGMKGLAVRIARGLNKLMGTRGRVIADRYHARILRTPREVKNALASVLKNLHHRAKTWGKRVQSATWLDPCASGRWFDGWRWPTAKAASPRQGTGALAGPAQRTGPTPVARPHTWLLRTGWRRHGLIAPA